MEGQHQKPGAIAKTLNVSTVTVRNYVKEFHEFLSPGATGDTNRKFTPEDVKVLRLASSLLRDGSTYEQVRQQLKEHLPIEGEILEDVEPPLHEEPPGAPSGGIAPLEFFTQFVDALKEEHKSTLQAQAEHLETLRQENARLQAEIERLRTPFFVRWFRKPPGTI